MEAFPAQEDYWQQLEPSERPRKALKRVVLQDGDFRLEFLRMGCWQNIQFKEGLGIVPKEDRDLTMSQPRRGTVLRLLRILNIMRTHILLETVITKRGIYYDLTSEFNSQKQVDYIIQVASPAGLVVGNIKLGSEDCRQSPMIIPEVRIQ